MFLPEECSEREGIPDEIQRATEHDRREAESRIKAFAGFAQCFSEHHESTRYRGRHNHEDKIAHLVLGRACLPGPAQADPEKRNERKWCYQESPRQAEQSPTQHIGSDRPSTQSPRRNRDRGKVRYSDGLIDSRDAKGAHADNNETKKRDDAEKDVAHTADDIHWISLLIEAKTRSRCSAGLTRIGSATRKLSRAGTLARTPPAGSRS